MFRYLFLLSVAIISTSVNAQVDKETSCELSSVEAIEKLNDMFSSLDEVSRPALEFGKLDDKVVRQICSAAQGTLQDATSIKNTALANRACSSADVRKMADITIRLANGLIDQQKCR
jgi:hypothetical protein